MTQKVIALGFFDGVHIGHGALLNKAVSVARELGVASAAETFDVHPESVIFGRKLPLINNMEDREELMKELYSVDEVIFTHFDQDMMKVPWDSFIQDVLISGLGAVHLVCGHDYRFGYRGEGNPQLLQARCKELGIGCDVVPKVSLDGVTVSSTHIRDLIVDGAMEAAARFLGHPHRISGQVVGGKQLGRTLGIPTANIVLDGSIIEPAHGVYAGLALVDGKRYPAVTNIGVRPTVDSEGKVTVEPYLLGFNGDLYGKRLTLELHRYLRPEQKFPSVQALKEAIEENIRQTREMFQPSQAHLT